MILTILYVILFAVLCFALALAAGMFALFAFALRCIYLALTRGRCPTPTNTKP